MSGYIEAMDEDTLSRHTPERSTVARRCREFFLRRLERTENMKRRWSMCTVENKEDVISSVKTTSTPDILESIDRERTSLPGNINDRNDIDSLNEKKWKSNLDIAMNCLRQEITSLISQDNDLFRQLLTLHDSITELRDRHNSLLITSLSEERDASRSPSLESLSDTEDHIMSPSSTLSSCSSHNSTEQSDPTLGGRLSSSSGSRDSRSGSVCLRCRTGSKGAPPHRHRAISYINLYTVDDMDPYDSGVHLQGCHSDSDHEIFV